MFIKYQNQHNKERFELAVKHLLEHENFSPDSVHCIVKEKRTEDLNTLSVKQTPQLQPPSATNEKEGKKSLSLDPL